MVHSSQSYCQNYNFEIPIFLLFLLLSDTTMPGFPFAQSTLMTRCDPKPSQHGYLLDISPLKGHNGQSFLFDFIQDENSTVSLPMPSAHPVKLCVKLFHLFGCEFQTRAAVWWCEVKEEGQEGLRKSRVGNRGMLPPWLRKLIFRLGPGIKIELKFFFLIDSCFLLLSPDILKIIASKGNSFR